MRFTILLSIFAMFVLAGCAAGQSGKKSNITAEEGVVVTTNSAGDVIISSDLEGVDLSDTSPGSEGDFVTTVGNRVLFGYNQHSLTSEAQNILTRQAQWLNTYPNVFAVVEGHADERGTREYNLALGARRANAVRDFLVAAGVESGRLETISYGKERPSVLGSNEESWAQNRRSVTNIQ